MSTFPPTRQVTITIGFYAGVALIDAGCRGAGSSWCRGISLMEYAVRSLVMLSTVVAINFNITHIRFCIQVRAGFTSKGFHWAHGCGHTNTHRGMLCISRGTWNWTVAEYFGAACCFLVHAQEGDIS